jgi:hypothetical protein
VEASIVFGKVVSTPAEMSPMTPHAGSGSATLSGVEIPPEPMEGRVCALIWAIVFPSLNIGAALGELEVQP